MRKPWCSYWSFNTAIHYRMARFKVSVCVIRQRRLRRQTDGVKRGSVNDFGLTLLLQRAAQVSERTRELEVD